MVDSRAALKRREGRIPAMCKLEFQMPVLIVVGMVTIFNMWVDRYRPWSRPAAVKASANPL
jgi:transcription elongation factor Elf1